MDSGKDSQHPNNQSPLRKQLAKKIINYYDQLSTAKPVGRSSSPPTQKDRSGSKGKDSVRNSQNLRDSKEGITSTSGSKKMTDKEILEYQEMEHRRLKMAKLKDLMKSEHDRADTDHALEPDYDTLQKLHPGFPSMMKEDFSNEKMLEDHHHTNIKVLLDEKVAEIEKLPQEGQEVVEEQEEDVVGSDNKLYHIVTRKTISASTKVEQEGFDFHQRKAKEIRRIQYAANIGLKKPKPESYFPVWVLVDGRPVASGISSENDDFKLDKQKGTLTVNPEQSAKVKPKDEKKPVFNRFAGTIKKPTHHDGDCDFVVVTQNGERHKILVSLRPEPPKTRHIANANSTIVDPRTGTPLGRARSNLVGADAKTRKPVQFAKGILIDSDNNLTTVLLKILNDKECIIKKQDLTETLEDIIGDEEVDLGDGINARKLVLKKQRGDNSPFPKEVFMYVNSFFLQPMKIFDNEFISSECENMLDYNGKTEWVKNGDGPDSEQVLIHFKNEAGKADVVQVIFDDAYASDISGRMHYLAHLAKLRYQYWLASLKQKSNTLDLEELKFDILDGHGKKMKILLRNDPDNEQYDVSEDEEDDLPLDKAHYQLRVDQGVQALPVRRKTKGTKEEEHDGTASRNKKNFEVKFEGATFKFSNSGVQESSLHSSNGAESNVPEKVRKDLSAVAKKVGLHFHSNRLFESFVHYICALPPQADIKKAAVQYKSLLDDVYAL